MPTVKKVLALFLCFLISISSLQFAYATEDLPTLTPAIEEPTLTPEEPTAASTPEEPTSTPEEPTSTPEEPTSTPEESTSTPEEPTSTPEEPTPTPTIEEPTPTPAGEVAFSEPPVITETPQMPLSPAATPSAIDYTKDASFSPSFAVGYAELLGEATVYEGGQSSVKKALISNGIVYAVSRTDPDAAKDRLFIAFALADAVIETGYIESRDVRPMSPDETSSYLSAASSDALCYQNNRGIPLTFIQYEPYGQSEMTTRSAMQMENSESDNGGEGDDGGLFPSMMFMASSSPDDITLEASPDVFDLYSGSANHVNVAITWTCASPLSFVSITGMTEMTHYSVSGNSVIINTGYLSTLPAGDHTFTINLYGDSSISVNKTISVVDTTPVCSVDPDAAEFDRNPASLGYKDLIFNCTGAAFAGINGLTKGVSYNNTGNTVTIYKEYLATLPLADETFQFRLGEGDGVLVPVTVKIMDSDWKGLAVDEAPVSMGSGSGWTYASNVLTILSGEHTISGISDYAVIVVNDGVSAVTLKDLTVNTASNYALSYIGHGTLTVQLQGSNTLKSSKYGMYGNDFGSFLLLGSGSLDASGICGANITIRSGTINANTSGETNYAIRASVGNLIISGGNIIASANGISYRYVLAANNNISISDGIINASASANYPYPLVAYNGTINISGGKITATAQASGNSSIWVFGEGCRASNFTMSGGSLDINLTASGGSSVDANGISAGPDGGNITINGGTINIYIRSSSSAYGITSSTNGGGSLVVNGGTIDITTESTGFSYGLNSYYSDVVVNGGRVSTNCTYGLFSKLEDVIVNGGQIIASGLYGLYTRNKSITIDGATIVANNIQANSRVDVRNSMVAAIGFQNLASMVDTMFFQGLNHDYTLQNNVSVKHDLSLPEGNTYTVPQGDSINIEDGFKLKLCGTLINHGTITGMVTDKDGNPIKVNAITLNSNAANILAGQTLGLTAAIVPNYAYIRSVTWSSSDTTVATVDQSGIVTAIKAGQAVISATSQDGGNVSVSCTVFVGQLATGITLYPTSANLGTWETLKLTPTILPLDTTEKTVSWTCSNNKMAMVDATGLVTPMLPGTVTITATINGISASAVLTITESPKPTAVFLNVPPVVTMNLNEQLVLLPWIMPSGARTAYTFSVSSGKSYVSVANGVVTALKEGTSTVKVTTHNKKTATVTIKVVDPFKPSSVSLNYTGTVILNLGQQLTLTPILAPSTAQATFTWSVSSGRSYVSVANGVVTALKEGTSTVKVTTHNKKTASVKIKVVDPFKPSAVSLNYTGTVILNLGQQLTLTPTLAPSTAQATFTWSVSSGRSYVSVTNGVVMALKEGTSIVNVATHNKKTASVKIKVVDPFKPSAVSLNYTGTVILNLGQQLTLTPTLAPSTAQATFTWSVSSGRNYVSVSNGVVTALSPGISTVNVATHNGKKAQVRIKVVDPN